jgi:hypothetical protein
VVKTWKASNPLLLFITTNTEGTLMGLKYCDKCQEAVEQIVMVCPKCKSEMFVHRKGDGGSVREHLDENAAKHRAQKNQALVAVQDSVPTSRLTDGISKTGKTIDDLIRAQNRTTHAVRAFVRFLFIQLTGITLAVFLWNISLAFIDEQACFQNGDNCTGNTFLQFAAAAVWIGSVIWSSRAGWDELYKSNID